MMISPLNGRTIPVFLCFLYLLVIGVSAQTPETESEAKAVSSPDFVLSNEARKAGIDGTITLAFKVDKVGVVSKAAIIAGPGWPCGTNPKEEVEKVREAVKENILSAKFSPQMKNGKPRDSELMVTFAIGNAFSQAIKEEEARKSGNFKLVDFGILNGKALNLPKPSYPPSARSQRVSGSVQMRAIIDEQGNVIFVGVTGGHPLLQEGSRTAACDAKFAPVVINGKPAKITGIMVYNFVAAP